MFRRLGKSLGLHMEERSNVEVRGWGLLFLWAYFLLWLAGVVFLYVNWSELTPWIKYPLAFFEALIAPDASIFRDLFCISPRGRKNSAGQ